MLPSVKCFSSYTTPSKQASLLRKTFVYCKSVNSYWHIWEEVVGGGDSSPSTTIPFSRKPPSWLSPHKWGEHLIASSQHSDWRRVHSVAPNWCLDSAQQVKCKGDEHKNAVEVRRAVEGDRLCFVRTFPRAAALWTIWTLELFPDIQALSAITMVLH